jgi:hypothetical protein
MTGDIYTSTTMTHPFSERPVLPNELHKEIVAHLHPNYDRRTLLDLALCSHSFRLETQQLLFIDMALVHEFNQCDHRAVEVHVRFLQAIISSPERLALYVRKYLQHSVALDPTCRRAHRE